MLWMMRKTRLEFGIKHFNQVGTKTVPTRIGHAFCAHCMLYLLIIRYFDHFQDFVWGHELKLKLAMSLEDKADERNEHEPLFNLK
jgi:hypothetical protein